MTWFRSMVVWVVLGSLAGRAAALLDDSARASSPCLGGLAMELPKSIDGPSAHTHYVGDMSDSDQS
jgi:hypothetical protein